MPLDDNYHRPAEVKFAAVKLEIKNIEDDGTFEGYASVFGNIDSHGDRVISGAFAESIFKKKAGEIAMLWQHRADEPIGVWTGFYEDERGLRATGRLILDTQRGREAYALMKAGAIRGLSIGFVTLEEREGNDNVREIVKVDLWEVSVVTFPSNTEANVMGVRSALAAGQDVAKRDMERALRDCLGLSKREAMRFMSEGFSGLTGERDAADNTDDVRDAEVKAKNEAAFAALMKTLKT